MVAMNPNQQLLLTAIGEAISSRRLEANITQLDLATSVGITRSYISDVERGLRNVTICTLDKIAGALSTTAAEILYDAERRERAAIKRTL